VIVQRVLTISSSAPTQLVVSARLGSVMVTMIAVICPTNTTAVSYLSCNVFVCYFVFRDNYVIYDVYTPVFCFVQQYAALIDDKNNDSTLLNTYQIIIIRHMMDERWHAKLH